MACEEVHSHVYLEPGSLIESEAVSVNDVLSIERVLVQSDEGVAVDCVILSILLAGLLVQSQGEVLVLFAVLDPISLNLLILILVHGLLSNHDSHMDLVLLIQHLLLDEISEEVKLHLVLAFVEHSPQSVGLPILHRLLCCYFVQSQ
jgi:hypothetical protein